MKIAFVSCCSIKSSKLQHKQPIWGIIQQQRPNLLLLLGDNVYISKKGHIPQPGETSIEAKKRDLAEKYIAQLSESHFKALLRDIPYLAIWDNHDFGLPGPKYEQVGTVHVPVYGAEVSPEHRQMARELFNKNLKNKSVVPDSEHVYCTHKIVDGNGKRIKFFMLDVRSFQEDPNKDYISSRIQPTLLGEDQEVWLLRELELSTADINVICSGVPYSYWKKYERWFHAFNLVAAKKSKLLFLGGGPHRNEFHRHVVTDLSSVELPPLPHRVDPRNPGSGFPEIPPIESTTMYEAVSSGVGRNFKKPGENDEEEEPTYRNNGNIIDNAGLDGKPRNNYGIIDFTDELVIITMYGQSADNMQYAAINRNDWTLKGYWSMQRSVPD